MCCYAHGREQLLSDVDINKADDQLTRSRVHLTLCWTAGNTMWVDQFEEAFRFVTGEKLQVSPPRERRGGGGGGDTMRPPPPLPSLSLAAVDDFLSNRMAPDTCEVFTRYDGGRGEDRRAVTLARGGGIARRERELELKRETERETRGSNP